MDGSREICGFKEDMDDLRFATMWKWGKKKMIDAMTNKDGGAQEKVPG
tara:strand:+ start:1569 stop:1712 length:144 start_codon:yes stop_codon:yes gene_type:complete